MSNDPTTTWSPSSDIKEKTIFLSSSVGFIACGTSRCKWPMVTVALPVDDGQARKPPPTSKTHACLADRDNDCASDWYTQ